MQGGEYNFISELPKKVTNHICFIMTQKPNLYIFFFSCAKFNGSVCFKTTSTVSHDMILWTISLSYHIHQMGPRVNVTTYCMPFPLLLRSSVSSFRPMISVSFHPCKVNIASVLTVILYYISCIWRTINPMVIKANRTCHS